MNNLVKTFHSVIGRYVIAKNLISNQCKIQCPPEKHAFAIFFIIQAIVLKHLQQKGCSTMTSKRHCSEGPRICWGHPCWLPNTV